MKRVKPIEKPSEKIENDIKKLKEEIINLIREKGMHNYITQDMHFRNVGMCDGNMVIIDYGWVDIY